MICKDSQIVTSFHTNSYNYKNVLTNFDFYIWVIDLDRSNSNQINHFAWIPLYNVKIHFNSIQVDWNRIAKKHFLFKLIQSK